jgi:hypothetical protein
VLDLLIGLGLLILAAAVTAGAAVARQADIAMPVSDGHADRWGQADR